MHHEHQRLLTDKQAAAILGISQRHIWRLAGRGVLRPVRINRCTRFRSCEIEGLIEHGTERVVHPLFRVHDRRGGPQG